MRVGRKGNLLSLKYRFQGTTRLHRLHNFTSCPCIGLFSQLCYLNSGFPLAHSPPNPMRRVSLPNFPYGNPPP